MTSNTNTSRWRYLGVFLLGVLAGTLIVLAVMFLLVRLSYSPPNVGKSEANDKSGIVATAPVVLSRKFLDVPLPSDLADLALKELVLLRPASLSVVLHAIRLYGWDAHVPHPTDKKRSDPALQVILDHRLGIEYFDGEAPLISTRDGVRCRIFTERYKRTQGERQAHSGQLLATLAESGVPLSTPLTTSSGNHQVQDILNDTIANFSVDDSELEWTAVALAVYLAPQSSWKDKFGRQTTFDDLATRLIETPFDKSGLACQGTHLLYALTVMLRVNDQKQILSSTVAESTRRHLRENVARLCRNQAPNGGWPVAWYSDQPEKPNETVALLPGAVREQLSVTIAGHHLEWMLLLPDRLAPPDEVYRRAGLWLYHALDTADLKQLHEGYCPYSHAAFVLSRLSASPKSGTEKSQLSKLQPKDFMEIAIRGS